MLIFVLGNINQSKEQNQKTKKQTTNRFHLIHEMLERNKERGTEWKPLDRKRKRWMYI